MQKQGNHKSNIFLQNSISFDLIKFKYFFTFLLIFSLNQSLYGQATKITVEGFVIDKKTNERIESATIFFNNEILATSNEEGYFLFKITPGSYIFEVSILGYESGKESLVVEKDSEEEKLFFKLMPKPIEIENITVSGEKFIDNIESETYELQPGDLQNIPQFGEPDVFRAIQALPGVNTIMDFSAMLYVRGGNFSETLIAIDDIPVYNPYHLSGIFGMFNPDMVQVEKLYPSNYPARYGGYLSGVLNIISKNGNSENYKGKASLGLVSSKVYLEGPILNGSLVLSARRTYLDLIASFFPKGEKFPYSFYDLHGKYTFPIDDKNLISVFGFISNDIYKIQNEHGVADVRTNPKWGNRVLSFGYTHIINNFNSIDIKLYYSKSLLNLDADTKYSYYTQTIEDTIFVDNSIGDLTAELKYDIVLTGHKIEAGGMIKKINTDYNWSIDETDLSGIVKGPLENIFYDYAENPFLYGDNINIVTAYFLDEVQLDKRINISGGIRGSYISKYKKMFYSPSINLKYKVSENLTTNLRYGKYHQYLYTIKEEVESANLMPFASYLLAEDKNDVASSDHYSISIKTMNLFENTSFEITGYYKNRKNLATRNNNETKYFNGYAAGIDVLLKKEKGAITGWIGYSFSRSVKKGAKQNYLVPFDRTNNVKILLNYKLSESWQFTSFWTYATGLPFTPSVAKFVGIDNDGANEYDWRQIDGRKNSVRFPDYHRLDVGINGSFIWGGLLVKPYLQVLNVYNSANPFYFDKKEVNTNLEDGEERGSYIIPTFGVSIEF